MGACGTKKATKGTSDAEESANEPTKVDENHTAGLAGHAVQHALPSGGAKISTAAVHDVATALGATTDQLAFLTAWTSCILDKAHGYKSIHVTTDGRHCELRVFGETKTMVDLAKQFTHDNELPDQMVSDIESAQTELQAKNSVLWCRLKDLGGNALTQPSIDAGIDLDAELQWALADVLMPTGADMDILRDYCRHQDFHPASYGCSIFVEEPERRLSFDLTGVQKQNLKKSLLSAFFFYKTLGFAKPEDNVVRILSQSNPAEFAVVVAMGPRGLTRLSLFLWGTGATVAKDLAETVNSNFNSEVLDKIKEILDAQAVVVSYEADNTGFSVSVGFTT